LRWAARAAIEPHINEGTIVTSTTKTHRLIAVLNMPLHVEDEIKYGQTIQAAMTNNSYFPNPNPVLAAFVASLGKYDTAATAAKTRAKGTIPARNAARTDYIAALHSVRGQVQTVADANQENAEAIITSAAMSVKKTPVHKSRTFEARQLTVSGSVELITKAAGPRAAYDWQYSTDGGKTWIDVVSTTKAKTTIPGLPVATNVMFRFRTLTPKGRSDWSQPTSLLVK
jgi:hypothetical protein